jgi:hypothetical protein
VKIRKPDGPEVPIRLDVLLERMELRADQIDKLRT